MSSSRRKKDNPNEFETQSHSLRSRRIQIHPSPSQYDSDSSLEYSSDDSLDISSYSEPESPENHPPVTANTKRSRSPNLTFKSHSRQSHTNQNAHSDNQREEINHHNLNEGVNQPINLCRFLLLFTLFVVACAVILTAFRPFQPNSHKNALSASTQDLELELKENFDFPASFHLDEFINLFKYRFIGKPTVLHLVSTSTYLPYQLLDWLRQKFPCDSSISIPALSASFIESSRRFANRHANSNDNNESDCRVIFTVQLKNAQFDKGNRDWLESVIDDSRSFAYTDKGQVPTEDWCVILMDHWTTDFVGEQIMEWSKDDPDTIKQRIRDITVPLWSGRFYQRIQAILFL